MRPLRPSWLHLGLPYPNRVPCLQGWTGGACALTHLLVGKPLVRLLWLPEAKTGPIPCRETSEPCVRGESRWTHLPPSTKRRVESHAVGASGSRRLPSSSLSHLLWPKVIRMQEHLLPRDLGGCGWDSMVPSFYCDLCDSSKGRSKGRVLLLGRPVGEESRIAFYDLL